MGAVDTLTRANDGECPNFERGDRSDPHDGERDCDSVADGLEVRVQNRIPGLEGL